MNTSTSVSERLIPWGTRSVTRSECVAYAERVTPQLRDRDIIASNLADFPPQITVRGVFFEGLARIIAQTRSAGAVADLTQKANVPGQTTAFRFYPHRDFYKLYYAAARLLYPHMPFPVALRRTAKTFFPIFRGSLIGKTMSALMGDKPKTILPLLAKAYSISVNGNEHTAELTSERTVTWNCRVEPVEWYVETFTGIVEGTIPEGASETLTVRLDEKTAGLEANRYRFTISW